MKPLRISQENRFKGPEGIQVLIFILILFIFTFGLSEGSNAVEKNLPFSSGEKLTLHVKWGFINAGEAVLEVLSPEIVNGIKSQHFALTLKSSPFVDCFYKVRDRMDSFVDMEMTRSILYKKKKEGHGKKDSVVNFNWEKKQAQYSNFGRKRAPIAIFPGSLDPLSVFYAFRHLEVKTGEEYQKPVTDGKLCIMGKLHIVRKEQIKVGGKAYDTYLVEINLGNLDSVFGKRKDAKLEIWVTADRFHIPLRIKSSVVVGNFVAEVVSPTVTSQ